MEIHRNILSRFQLEYERIDRTLYKLSDGSYLLIRTSKAHDEGERKLYWFGFHKSRLEFEDLQNLFVLFACGSDKHVVIMPAVRMLELLDDVATASDDNWKIKIYESGGAYEMVLTGKPSIPIDEFLNQFKLLGIDDTIVSNGESLVESPIKAELSIEEEILDLDGVKGKTLHDRLIDMLYQVGSWMDYDPKTEYGIRHDSPYKLDVAWIANGAIHIAIEVQVGGNVTEAKDRLSLARKFGARKLILVSTPDKIDRIRSVFRYESDVRNWLEVWGLEPVLKMFVDGRSFIESYSQFNSHKYREDITEIIDVESS